MTHPVYVYDPIEIQQTNEPMGAVRFAKGSADRGFFVGPSALTHGLRMVSGNLSAIHPEDWGKPGVERL